MTTKKMLIYAGLAVGAFYVYKQVLQPKTTQVNSQTAGTYTDQGGTSNPFVNLYSQLRNYFAVK